MPGVVSQWHQPTIRKPRMPTVSKSKAKASPKVASTRPAKTNAVQKPLQRSPELAEIVGGSPMSRRQVVMKVWEFIRARKLQNPADKREILADAKLKLPTMALSA